MYNAFIISSINYYNTNSTDAMIFYVAQGCSCDFKGISRDSWLFPMF